MAQRQASSTNDHLTIAGLLVLGLTSALVGALVVAPTLAPKRLAMASDLPEEVAKPAPTKKPVMTDAELRAMATLNTGANSPANGPAGAAETLGPGNVPGANGPDESLGNSSVTIRTPGEVVGPPLPPGYRRPESTTARETETVTSSDRRGSRDDEKSLLPENGTSKSDDEADNPSSGRRRERRDSDGEPTASERRNGESTSSPERTEPGKEDEPKPGEGSEAERSAGRSRVYRVQSGKFNTREEAQKAQLELAKSGKGGFIVPSGDGYLLQLGVFRSRENAEKAADAARAQSIVVDVRPEREARR